MDLHWPIMLQPQESVPVECAPTSALVLSLEKVLCLHSEWEYTPTCLSFMHPTLPPLSHWQQGKERQRWTTRKISEQILTAQRACSSHLTIFDSICGPSCIWGWFYCQYAIRQVNVHFICEKKKTHQANFIIKPKNQYTFMPGFSK